MEMILQRQRGRCQENRLKPCSGSVTRHRAAGTVCKKTQTLQRVPVAQGLMPSSLPVAHCLAAILPLGPITLILFKVYVFFSDIKIKKGLALILNMVTGPVQQEANLQTANTT